MADENNNKRLLQLQVLVRVDADTTDKARVLGGNLARQIEANIPAVYEVVGVELQSDNAEADAKRSAKVVEKDTNTVLKT